MFDRFTLAIRKLQWFPLPTHITLNMCSFIYKAVHSGFPPYLVDKINTVNAGGWNESRGMLCQPIRNPPKERETEESEGIWERREG